MGRFRLVVALITLLLPSLAWAQDGASVMILKLENTDADPAVVSSLDETLRAKVDTHEEMQFKAGGELTVKDLAITAGCASPDETCMKMLRDFVDADRMIFGGVQASGDVYLFSLKMFDFSQSRFVAEITDQTVQGDVATVTEVIPALVDGFLYGNVGVLTVDVTGADSPELLFDGEKLGLAPTTLENLPLGQHVVTLKTSGGQEQSQTVVLERGQTETISFAFEPEAAVVAGGGTEAGGGPSVVPGIVSLGLGVVGIAVGAYASLQVQDANDKNEQLGPYVDTETGGFLSEDERDAAISAGLDPSDIEKQGKTFQTVQWVGYGVGAIGLGLGTFLLVRALGSESAPAETAALPFDFGVVPTHRGVSASLRLRF